MAELLYLVDATNAARHREWQRLKDAQKNKRISKRKAKRLATAQAKLESVMRGEKPSVKRKPKPPKKTRTPKPPAQFQGSPTYRLGLRAEDFYQTREWFEVRYQALLLYSARCMCCGASGSTVHIHVDHIKPRSKFPSLELDLDNLQVLCRPCNLGKSNKDQTDWRPKGAIIQPG